jgi:DNA-binding beta-propeller fold protein YncE
VPGHSGFGWCGYCDMDGTPWGPVGYGLACSPAGDLVAAVNFNNPELPEDQGVFQFAVPESISREFEGELAYIEKAFDLEYAHYQSLMFVVSMNDSLYRFDPTRVSGTRCAMYVAGAPRLFDISENDHYAFVSHLVSPGLTTVNLQTMSVCAELELPNWSRPWVVRLSPDQNYAFVCEEDTGLVRVADVSDPDAPRWVGTIATGSGRPRDICFAPDGSRAYVAVDPDGIVVLE